MTGATTSRCRLGGGAGSVWARTIAGGEAAGRTEKDDGVCVAAGPARKRGNAAAPATAPASNNPAKTPLVMVLMVPSFDADGIARTRYRQIRTRA